jgi:hypothetical protein
MSYDDHPLFCFLPKIKPGKKMKPLKATILSAAALLTLGTACHASDADAMAQANNPLANMKAFNIHNYYMGELTDSSYTANQMILRYAQPIELGNTNWLLRASLPIKSSPVLDNGDKKHGLGDFNIFAAYLMDVGNPAVSFGVGPMLDLPTATDDRLGTEKYSAGVANILFDASSRLFQYGYLLTYSHSFAGNSDRDTVSLGAFQPFAMLQLGGGTYLRSVGIWFKDFEHDIYSIPVGLGVGQVFKRGSTVFNLFIEPQYSIADKGAGIPKWQVFTGLNMQFYGN